MADLIADAVQVVIAVDGDTYTSPALPNTGYGTEPGEDELAVGQAVERSAWWFYEPASDGDAYIVATTEPGDPPARLGYGQGGSIGDMLWFVRDDSANSIVGVLGGRTYAVQVGVDTDTDATYTLTVTGPHNMAANEIPGPAVRLQLRAVEPASDALVEAPASYLFAYALEPEVTDPPSPGTELVAAPAAIITAEAVLPTGPLIVVSAPPAAVTVAATISGAAVVATFTSAHPADESTVPATRPVFVFGIAMEYGTIGLAQLAYDDNEDFTSPTTIEFEPYTIDGTPVHRIIAAADLADDTYWWRLRAHDGTGWQPWVVMGEFTVDTADLSGAAPGAMTVVTGDPPARLWFVHPASGVVGDKVTLYGIGLIGAGTETVTIDGITAPIDSQTQVLAGDDAYTADRVLSPDGPTITVEHDRVVILVPDGTDEGGPLVLVRG